MIFSRRFEIQTLRIQWSVARGEMEYLRNRHVRHTFSIFYNLQINPIKLSIFNSLSILFHKFLFINILIIYVDLKILYFFIIICFIYRLTLQMDYIDRPVDWLQYALKSQGLY